MGINKGGIVMKAILISIKPKYVAKILNGEKTIEIRKTMPKCDLPIDVYIYCTKEDNLCCIKRIGRDRYICGKDFDLRDFPHLSSGYEGKGKVVAKFTLKKVVGYPYISDKYDKLIGSCLSEKELLDYSTIEYNEELRIRYVKTLYAWHISNLVIFDKPKELSEFETTKQYLASVIGQTQPILQNIRLTKAPQSYCYVEELK